MKQSVKKISLFLGVSMFAFGTLKFINPFKYWYTAQVLTSELPYQQFSYWSGQLGEIISGLAFIILILFRKIIPQRVLKLGFTINNTSIMLMMLVAVYVHVHPNVPNDVLPLKIKPPVIPVFFLVLAILNIWLNKRKTAHNRIDSHEA